MSSRKEPWNCQFQAGNSWSRGRGSRDDLESEAFMIAVAAQTWGPGDLAGKRGERRAWGDAGSGGAGCELRLGRHCLGPLDVGMERVCSISLGLGRKPARSPVGSRRKAPQPGRLVPAGVGTVPPHPLGLAGCFSAHSLPSSKKALVLSRAVSGSGHSTRFDPHTPHPGWRNVKPPTYHLPP